MAWQDFFTITGKNKKECTPEAVNYEINKAANTEGVNAAIGTEIDFLAQSSSNIEEDVSNIESAVALPSSWINDKNTVAAAGTPQQVSATSVGLIACVTIKAASTNTGNIFVGYSSAMSKDGHGTRLAPGEQMPIIIDNLNKIWVDTATSGNTYDYWGS